MIALYPALYCAPGVPAPAWVWPGAIVQCLPEGGHPEAPGGTCYGDAYAPGDWRSVAPGLWLRATPDLLPQQLQRMHPEPRVIHWHTTPGPLPGHLWRVPALIAYDAATADWYPCTDRILSATGWVEPAYSAAQQALAALAAGRVLGPNADEDLTDLACTLLSIGHHVDRSLLAALGWISEATIVRVVRAAYLIQESPELQP